MRRLRDVAPVDLQPTVTLVDWRAYEVTLPSSTRPTRHVAGFVLENGRVRVSSEISDVDVERALISTYSGRAYRLQGAPGERRDVRLVWLSWVSLNEADVVREVTAEVVRALGRLQ